MNNEQMENEGNSLDFNKEMLNIMYKNQERQEGWFLIGGLLLILLILLFLTNQNKNEYNMRATFPNTTSAIQTNVVQDKLYITNGQNGTISVVDIKTDQVKMVLPFC